MMSVRRVLVLSALIGCCLGQRGSYAGRRPIGYPAFTTVTTPTAALGNRFGDDVSTTTVSLPIEALGNHELVERLSKLPTDKQPFWLINWQALENNRRNPQSFQSNPNSFIDPFPNQNGQQNAQAPVTQTQNAGTAESTNFRATNGLFQRSGETSAGNRVLVNGQLIDPNGQSGERFQVTNRVFSNRQVPSAAIRTVNTGFSGLK